jgi:hypothetical protein
VSNCQCRQSGAIVPLSARRMNFWRSEKQQARRIGVLVMLERADSYRFVVVRLAGSDDWLRRVIVDYMLASMRKQGVSFGLVGATQTAPCRRVLSRVVKIATEVMTCRGRLVANLFGRMPALWRRDCISLFAFHNERCLSVA